MEGGKLTFILSKLKEVSLVAEAVISSGRTRPEKSYIHKINNTPAYSPSHLIEEVVLGAR